MFGSKQRRTDKCVTPSTKESCPIYWSYEELWPGNLGSARTIVLLCALYKAYSGERASKAVSYRLQRAYYLSRVEHVRKIRDRRQRKDIGKYYFVNKTSQLPAEVLGTFPCKPKIFRHRVRKANINRGEMEGIEVRWKSSKSAGKWSEVKWGEMER